MGKKYMEDQIKVTVKGQEYPHYFRNDSNGAATYRGWVKTMKRLGYEVTVENVVNEVEDMTGEVSLDELVDAALERRQPRVGY